MASFFGIGNTISDSCPQKRNHFRLWIIDALHVFPLFTPVSSASFNILFLLRPHRVTVTRLLCLPPPYVTAIETPTASLTIQSIDLSFTQHLSSIEQINHQKSLLCQFSNKPPSIFTMATPKAPTPEEVMGRVRQELEEQQMEELVQTLSEKCFEKCVKKPGTSLTTAEQHCIAKAMDRYIEVMNLVFHTVAKRAQS